MIVLFIKYSLVIIYTTINFIEPEFINKLAIKKCDLRLLANNTQYCIMNVYYFYFSLYCKLTFSISYATHSTLHTTSGLINAEIVFSISNTNLPGGFFVLKEKSINQKNEEG